MFLRFPEMNHLGWNSWIDKNHLLCEHFYKQYLVRVQSQTASSWLTASKQLKLKPFGIILTSGNVTVKVIGDLKTNTSSIIADITYLVESWKIAAEREDCLNSIENAIQCGNGVIDVIDGYFISKTFAWTTLMELF